MIKALILGLMLSASIHTQHDVQLPNTDWKLISNISAEYKIPKHQAAKAVYLANKHAKSTFPTKLDILAIMAVESNFNPKAVSTSNAKGLMQILYTKTKTDTENVYAGVWLLKDYSRKLHSEFAAIHAYNIGIGNYMQGRRASKYYDKYMSEKQKLEQLQTT